MQNPFYIQQPDLVEQYGRGYEIGAMQREDQKAQQAEAANAEMMQQYQNDLYSVYQNPEAGAREYGALQIKYPQMADSIKKTFEGVDGEKQKTLISDMTQVYSAVQNSRPEYAVSLLREKADAARNAGDESQAKKYEDMAQMGELDPMLLKDSTGMTLYAIKGGDYLSGIAKAPYAGTEAEAGALKSQAEAVKSTAEAAVAEDSAVLDVTGKAEDIKGKKLKRQIDVIDSQISASKSDIEREKLQIERDKVQQEADKISLERDKLQGADAQMAQDTLDTASAGLDTVNELMKHPGLRSGTGRGGDFAAWFNGSDAADFRAQLKTVDSQQFLTAIKQMKGMGALSDAEGSRLSSAVASLDTAQSSQQMLNALGTIRNTLRKVQEKTISRGKAPTSGGVVVADTKKYGKIKEGDINRVMEANPGSTREQVIKFLQTQGQ
jgi:hypothetical protein